MSLHEQNKKEFEKGMLVMLLTFIWGLLLLFVISALFGKPWIWHLSWNLVPIIAFFVALIYDTNHEVVPDVDVAAKEVWEELSEGKITIIKAAEPYVTKRYTGIH